MFELSDMNLSYSMEGYRQLQLFFKFISYLPIIVLIFLLEPGEDNGDLDNLPYLDIKLTAT